MSAIPLPSRVPPKLTPRADFRPEEFRKRILSHGARVYWEQAIDCPCARPVEEYGFSSSLGAGTLPANARARADCPSCAGRGYAYHSGQEITALVTGARTEGKRFSEYGGELSSGQIGITLLPEHLPRLGDRFTLIQSEMLFSETLTRGSGATDSPRYQIKIRAHDLAAGPQSFGVRYLLLADAQGEVDPSETRAEGVDFTISAGGEIDWSGAPPLRAPAQGSRYSVTYYAHPRYMIVNHPHAVRDSQAVRKSPSQYEIELPIYAEARLEFLGGA